MQAGAFPSLAPQSAILDEAEREALARAGLPIDTRDVWDERERELFRVLVAGARRSLTLSYAGSTTGDATSCRRRSSKRSPTSAV